MRSLITVVAPEAEPVSLALAKRHLAIDHDDDDDWITAAIAAAREATEAYTGRRWVTQTVRLVLSTWPNLLDVADADFDPTGSIRIPVQPVQSVSSVKYLDDSKVEQMVDPDELDTWLDHAPPLVGPDTVTGYWPDHGDYLGAIRVAFVAGYGDAEDVPAMVPQAMLLAIGNWYENRADQNVTTAKGLPPSSRHLLDHLWTGTLR